jgi:hypothetical protein
MSRNPQKEDHNFKTDCSGGLYWGSARVLERLSPGIDLDPELANEISDGWQTGPKPEDFIW